MGTTSVGSAEHALELVRPAPVAGDEVDVPCPQIGRLDGEAQTLLAAPQATLGGLAGMRVGNDPDPVGRRAGGVDERDAVILDPAPLPALVPQAILDDEGGAPRYGILDDGAGLRPVLRMERREPVLGPAWLVRLAGERRPASPLGALAGDVEMPDDL